MTRDRAQQAVDEAFAGHIAKLFSTLISNLVSNESGAGAAFERGLAAADDAHTIASGIVERVFAE